jgi:hypothetical protein
MQRLLQAFDWKPARPFRTREFDIIVPRSVAAALQAPELSEAEHVSH